MAKNIEPKLRKIGDYLKLDDDVRFIIPEYQRAYSWEIDRCDKLWQDINDYTQSESKDRYFFGTIIINCQENDTELVLIDGQQRTTTFLLLLKALLDRINEEIPKIYKDDESAAICRGLQERRRKIMGILYKVETEMISDIPNKVKDAEIYSRVTIFENHSINEKYKDELTTILKTIDYEEAKNNVRIIPHKQKDNKYTHFFRNYKYFYDKIYELQITNLNTIAKTITDNCEVIEIKSWQVEQAITMFNSLNSDGLPLYDSDIISAKLYAKANDIGKETEFSSKWEELNTQIDELTNANIANINTILMQYMYLVRTINRETVNEKGTTDVTTPGLRRYFTEINKEIIRDPMKMCMDMVNLVRIWKEVADYPLLHILLKYNENSKLFLASYFSRYFTDIISPRKVEIILKCMLRLFVILELCDYGYSSKYFKTFLFAEQLKLVDKQIEEKDIEKDFDIHIKSKWDRDTIKNYIEDYDGNLLVYLNEYLFANEQGVPFVLGSRYDIEHIMPNSGNNLQEIRRDADIESKEEFDNVVNKVGNKILLEGKINRAIGNEWFRTKVSTKLEDKTGYINSQYPIAKALVKKYQEKDKPYWKKDDIMAATKEVSDRIVKFIFNE